MPASKNRPVISRYILLAFFIRSGLFNDINTIVSTTWDSKMVSATTIYALACIADRQSRKLSGGLADGKRA